MESKNLVICDREADYASALARYLMQREELSVQIQNYSNLSYVLAMQKKENIDFLFISSEYPLEDREQVLAKNIFVLAGERKVEVSNRETLIYKYCPGDEILVRMIQTCNESGEEGRIFLQNVEKERCKIITVFSPVHRVGKTTYAMRLGQKFSRDGNVLYLDMETYGGLREEFSGREQSLSDLLYYVRQEQSNLGMILPTMITRIDELDCIAPVKVSEDIKEITGEEWLMLFQRIMEESIYEILILDIDEGVRNLYSILRASSEIHMLTADDPTAESKIRQFEEEIMLLGYEDIRRKIIRKEQHA